VRLFPKRGLSQSNNAFRLFSSYNDASSLKYDLEFELVLPLLVELLLLILGL
jgi:hypothetical protein